MNNDFSRSKTGDWAWTIKDGWCKVMRIKEPGTFPLRIGNSDYTIDGKYTSFAKSPSAFLVPPAEFNAGPPPCDLKEGDKVIVWNNDEGIKWRAYFSHIEKSDNQKYYCFSLGDKWTSYGDTRGWKHCEKWEEENG